MQTPQYNLNTTISLSVFVIEVVVVVVILKKLFYKKYF
jgi:uncharacterized membrane protein (DUF2068 family)